MKYYLSFALLLLLIPTSQSIQTEKIVYGADNRIEFFQASQALQELSEKSVVALVRKNNLICDSDVCVFKANNESAVIGLCPDQPFANQTSAAYCSGTLIGEDRVATAGNCITSDADCLGTYFVFKFYFTSPENLSAVSKSADVYECKRYFSQYIPGTSDWSLVQLDRIVDSSHSPVEIATEAPIPDGEDIVMIGFPGGVPLKIDDSSQVSDSNHVAFFAGLDSFGGNSGSGIFRKSDLKQLGILVNGNQDYVLDASGDCLNVNHVNVSDFQPDDLEVSVKIWRLLELTPNCTRSLDCPNNSSCATDGAEGFCLLQSEVCSLECARTYEDCCFAGNTEFSACATCKDGARCGLGADQCYTCPAGYEIQVIYVDCSGYCVPEGTSSLLPSVDVCPGFYPRADCDGPNCQYQPCPRSCTATPPPEASSGSRIPLEFSFFVVLFGLLFCK